MSPSNPLDSSGRLSGRGSHFSTAQALNLSCSLALVCLKEGDVNGDNVVREGAKCKDG